MSTTSQLSRKRELIDKICEYLAAGVGDRLFGPNARTVSTKDRDIIEQTWSVQSLEAKLKTLQDEALRPIRAKAQRSVEQDPAVRAAREEVIWNRFFFQHADIVDNAANRKLIFDRAVSLGDDISIGLPQLDEAAKLLADTLSRRNVPTTRNLEQDKETLQQYCRTERLHYNEAALRMLREQFGAGFTSADIDSALQTRAIELGAATPEELAIWAKEDAEARTEYLLTAPKQVLKQEAKKESEQRRSAAIAEADRQHVEAVVSRDAAFGNFPQLPETWNGEKLDGNFIKKCSVETHKRLTRQFGSAQLDLRLRGIK